MQSNLIVARRLGMLNRVLNGRNWNNVQVRYCSSKGKVTIGNVTKEVREPKFPEYVPRNYCKFEC